MTYDVFKNFTAYNVVLAAQPGNIQSWIKAQAL